MLFGQRLCRMPRINSVSMCTHTVRCAALAELFRELPLAAVVADTTLVVHGGLWRKPERKRKGCEASGKAAKKHAASSKDDAPSGSGGAPAHPGLQANEEPACAAAVAAAAPAAAASIGTASSASKASGGDNAPSKRKSGDDGEDDWTPDSDEEEQCALHALPVCSDGSAEALVLPLALCRCACDCIFFSLTGLLASDHARAACWWQ